MFSRSVTQLQQRTAARIRSVVPLMQLFNIQPDPVNGSLTKISAESRGIRIAVFPQLGAPNTDPQDQTPQFDSRRRAISTLLPHEAASLLAVLNGSLPSYSLESEFRNLTFAPSTEGKRAFTLTGTLIRHDLETIPVNITFEKSSLTTFHRFVESAIDEGFGFHQYFNPPRDHVIRDYEQKQRVLRREKERSERETLRRLGFTNNNNKNNNNNNNTNKNNNNNNNNSKNGSNNNNNNTNNNNRNRNNNNNRNRNGNNDKKSDNEIKHNSSE